jgi:hypothetical protein
MNTASLVQTTAQSKSKSQNSQLWNMNAVRATSGGQTTYLGISYSPCCCSSALQFPSLFPNVHYTDSLFIIIADTNLLQNTVRLEHTLYFN